MERVARAELIDELHLVVGATVLGGGTPVFTAPVTGLEQAGAERLDGSDNVLLRYTADLPPEIRRGRSKCRSLDRRVGEA